MNRLCPKILQVVRPVVAAALGLALGLLVTALTGENPLFVLKVLWESSFGSSYDLGLTLFYSSILICTGLAVAIPFRAGMFNIGGEGQLISGAMAAALVGILVPGLPAPFSLILAIMAAFLFGGLWGLIPGVLKIYRGSHEVITTIMLNFVAIGITSWITLYLVKSLDTQNPETLRISPNYLLSQYMFFDGAPVSFGCILSIIFAIAIWLVMRNTVFGFESAATGENDLAARTAGINTGRIRLWSMFLAGAIAGIVGVIEVLGNAGRFRLGFSPDFGFMGIAVALLARGHPLGIIFSALLFGALHKGTSGLDLETEHVTRDLSSILQALVILAVSAEGIWDIFTKKKVKKT